MSIAWVERFVFPKTTAPAAFSRATTTASAEGTWDISSGVPPEVAAQLNERGKLVEDTDWHMRQLYGFAAPFAPSIVEAQLSRFVIDLSPFHTSLFITNLASINTEAIYHHCYEFGTTGVFVCMGKPVPNFLTGEYNKKIMPLGIVMDERIGFGAYFAAVFHRFKQYLSNPELLEGPPKVVNTTF